MEPNMPDGEEETGDRAREKRREMQRRGGERNEGTEKETEPQGDMGLFLRPRDNQEEGPQGPAASASSRADRYTVTFVPRAAQSRSEKHE